MLLSRLATSFVLGFHGCDRDTAERVISGSSALLKSESDYDWLGPGIYFWESDPDRAREWAEDGVRRSRIDMPAVVGAVIDLGNCLDLSVRADVEMLGAAHESLVATLAADNVPTPTNRDIPRGTPGNGMLRYLDCAVIRRLHEIVASDASLPRYDSVRGLFPEGEPAYPGAGFTRFSHRQIAVINPAVCIKGLFWPR